MLFPIGNCALQETVSYEIKELCGDTGFYTGGYGKYVIYSCSRRFLPSIPSRAMMFRIRIGPGIRSPASIY